MEQSPSDVTSESAGKKIRPSLMEFEIPLPPSQEQANIPYTGPDKSSPHSNKLSVYVNF
jgi:hypothetical protein